MSIQASVLAGLLTVHPSELPDAAAEFKHSIKNEYLTSVPKTNRRLP